MEIDMKDRKKIIFAMVEENTYITTEVIIWVTGLKAKCRERDSYLMPKIIWFMMESGKTIITRVAVDSWGMILIGPNTRGSFVVVRCRVLDKCGFMMVNDTKVSFVTMFLPERVVCLVVMEISRLVFGKRAILYHNFDLYLRKI
jgi:hypothetical protein